MTCPELQTAPKTVRCLVFPRSLEGYKLLQQVLVTAKGLGAPMLNLSVLSPPNTYLRFKKGNPATLAAIEKAILHLGFEEIEDHQFVHRNGWRLNLNESGGRVTLGEVGHYFLSGFEVDIRLSKYGQPQQYGINFKDPAAVASENFQPELPDNVRLNTVMWVPTATGCTLQFSLYDPLLAAPPIVPLAPPPPPPTCRGALDKLAADLGVTRDMLQAGHVNGIAFRSIMGQAAKIGRFYGVGADSVFFPVDVVAPGSSIGIKFTNVFTSPVTIEECIT